MVEDKVSVIVPIYNVEPYLRRCLDSLVIQKHKNIEILMVDDCSTDGSATIAKEYAEKYPQFLFIQREKNGGLAAARNTGMSVATGEWLAFVDSDDWVTEDYISAMYKVARTDNADIVMSSIYYYYSENRYKEVSPFGDLTTMSSQKEKVALSRAYAPTRLFRKAFVDTTGVIFPEDIKRSEDTATVIPWLTMTKKISILRKPMYYYYQRQNSLSNTNHKNVDTTFLKETIQRMIELSAPGFGEELEFRAISDLMYGMVMVMVRSKRSKYEVINQIQSFEKMYPKWRENTYIFRLPKGKKIFICCAAKEQYIMLKVLIKAWNFKQRIIG